MAGEGLAPCVCLCYHPIRKLSKAQFVQGTVFMTYRLIDMFLSYLTFSINETPVILRYVEYAC